MDLPNSIQVDEVFDDDPSVLFDTTVDLPDGRRVLEFDNKLWARDETGRVTLYNPPQPPWQDRMAILRRIVARKQWEWIGEDMVDAFTASMLVQIYDHLSLKHQVRFASMPLEKMVDLGWKLCHA